MHLHWDGDNDSVDERNLSAALGAGVTPVTVDHASIKRIRDWIWTLPPPKYPYPIDQALAARGASLYAQHCQSCHADNRFRDGVIAQGTRVGQVVPIADIGTDRHRLDSYTDEFAANQYALYPDFAVPVQPLQEDRRLCESSAGRHLAAGTVPSQRLGPDAPRLCSMPRRPAEGVLPRLRRVRSEERRLRVGCPPADGHDFSGFDTSVPGTATVGTSTARRSPTRTRRRWSST